MFAFSACMKLIALGYFKAFLTVLCRNLNEYFWTSHVHKWKKIYFEGVLIAGKCLLWGKFFITMYMFSGKSV